MNSNDKVILEELQNITKNKKDMTKTRKKIKITIWSIIVCNFLAGCFIGSIYFILKDIIYLIIGIFIVLLDIPIYIFLNTIIKKIDSNNEKLH
ncbi:MAG: hypothetical protein FWG85_02850 [Bacteroidetes bacterium]|nr:hypothetical protein [Bacteroidota bacterium]